MSQKPPPNEHASLAEAKAWLRAQVEKGGQCPCCRQRAQLYKRKLNSAMARFLVWLYLADRNESRWYHVGECPAIQNRASGGDAAKLRYWGFIEEKPKDPKEEKKRTSGLWRITLQGKAFVSDIGCTAPSHVFLYDGRVIDIELAFGPYLSEKFKAVGLVNIVEALGEDFNYRELMRGE